MQLLKHQPTNDQSPMAELYNRYAPTLLTSIRRRVPTREDAEDMLLDVFVAALENEKVWTLSEQNRLRWLQRVAHNKLVDHHRRASRRWFVPLGETIELISDDIEPTPEQSVLRHETYAQLRTHLSALPELQQEVLRLRFANDLRCAEIAEIIHKSEGAVRTMLSRSLNLLRSIYARHQEEVHNDEHA